MLYLSGWVWAVAASASPLAVAGDAPTVFTDSNGAVPSVLAREVGGWGIGVVLGLPTGLSVAYRSGRAVWFDGALGWSVDRGALHAHADVLFTLSHLRSNGIPDVDFPVYLGIGTRTRLGESPFINDGPVELGVRVPVGMSFIHDGLPVEGFLELAPGVDIYPNVQPLCDIAIGGRFYLP